MIINDRTDCNAVLQRDLKQLKNKYPELYDLAEKNYLEANEDVEVNPHGHIIIDKLTSYHAVRFFKLLLHLYDEELHTYDQE
ncbi:MAG: hypothetical protein MRZ89_03365 [Lachnospiraceae bacterium]|nr:hypothetical protein [Lachnospiraceae bacterium]